MLSLVSAEMCVHSLDDTFCNRASKYDNEAILNIVKFDIRAKLHVPCLG